MAIGKFNAQINIISSIANNDLFDITATIFDVSGYFTGLDVILGDLIYLDISNSPVDNALVARYQVTNITYQDGTNLTATIKYLDGNTVPDINDYLSQPAIIVRSSDALGLGFISSSSLQGIPGYLSDYARNIDNFEIIDKLSTTTPSASGYTFEEDFFNIISEDTTNKYVDLTSTPVAKESISANLYEGPILTRTKDYDLYEDNLGEAKRFGWTGMSLENVITDGDILVVKYQKK